MSDRRESVLTRKRRGRCADYLERANDNLTDALGLAERDGFDGPGIGVWLQVLEDREKARKMRIAAP